MLKQNKGKMILSSILILLPILVGLFLWNDLPAHMTTHWGADGNADGWSTKAFAVFGLPLILLVFHWVCVFFTAKDPGNKNQNRKVFGMIFWIIPMISICVNGTIYAISFDKEFAIEAITLLLIGLVFIVIGNYMPKCRQNATIGIKIKWTLENEENWNATHRVAGKLWVIGGLLLMVCMFLPIYLLVWAMLAVILLMVLIPFSYSYLYYKKQMKAGTYVKNGVCIGKYGKNTTVVGMFMTAAILIFCVVLCFTGDINVQYGETSFTMEASYYSDLTVDYAAIDSIEFREQDDPGVRTSGFGTPRLSMGTFKNEEFGTYTRYSYTGRGACVVLTVNDRILVINGKDDDSTKAIYEELLNRQ